MTKLMDDGTLWCPGASNDMRFPGHGGLCVEDFYKGSGTVYKLRGRCKVCERAYRAMRYKANPEREKTQAAAWRKANPERRKANDAAYVQANPEQHANYERVRRARKLDNPCIPIDTYTWNWYKGLWEIDGVVLCAYCGVREAKTTDHVIPIIQGGGDILSNLVPCCGGRGGCNSKKNGKPVWEWYKQQPFYSAERERVMYERMELALLHDGAYLMGLAS